MRKAILLSVLSVMLLTSKSNAQGFITSFGVTNQWSLPYEVYYTLDHQYWGYDLVHVAQITNRRVNYFDVVLQRGNVFVRLSVDPFGGIMNSVVNYNYPLVNHVCTNQCGFHSGFYQNNMMVCNHHHHHGHNHVVYRQPQPVYYLHSNGKAYGHHKNKHYTAPVAQQNNRSNNTPVRRSVENNSRSRQNYVNSVGSRSDQSRSDQNRSAGIGSGGSHSDANQSNGRSTNNYPSRRTQ